MSDIPMPQAYNVNIRLSYKVVAINGNKAKIENISVYADYLKGTIQDGVDYPDLEIGTTTLAGNLLNMVPNTEVSIHNSDCVFDDEIVTLNRWVNIGDEISSLAILMLDSSIWPYYDLKITTTVQLF